MSRDARVTGACLTVSVVVSLWAVRDSQQLPGVPGLMMLAVEYIAFSTVAALIVFAAARRWGVRCLRHTFFSCVAPAALMPGTVLLLSRQSMWGVVPAAAIAWLVGTGLRTHRPPKEKAAVRMSPLAPVAGGLVQLTLASVVAHEVTVAALSAVVGAMVTVGVPGAVLSVPRSQKCLDWRGSGRKWIVVFANAFALVCFALFPHVWGNRVPQVELPESAAAEEERSRAGTPLPPDDVFVRDSEDDKDTPAFVGGQQLTEQGDLTLRFPFPPALRRFDEVIVKYRLSLWRRDRAPRVSIRRFVFEAR